TGLLCGGAAVAMVLRHWGERTFVEEFAPLVDEEAGGIADSVLVAAVTERGWRTERLDGSMEALGGSLARGEPPVLLIEDRPGFLHYVVLVGMEPDAVLLHDPTWGPARRVGRAEFLAQWKKSRNWALLVLPAAHAEAESAPAVQPVNVSLSACDRELQRALEEIDGAGPETTAALLEAIRLECPHDSRPVSELAALRFAHREWDRAATLAREATVIDPGDEYAWDVLASSRFVQNEPGTALEAWNEIERPRIDLLAIEGLRHTRYALVAEAAGLEPGEVLTSDSLRRTERRLRQLPTIRAARVDYRPLKDGFAAVDATVVERSALPSSPVGWIGRGLGVAIDREISVDVPGSSGQGELWSGGWRWWNERPRLWFAFAAPALRGWPGVWRVELSDEKQGYAAGLQTLREGRVRGALEVAHWLTSSTWYQATAAIDVWNGDRRTLSAGARVERRFAGDRLALGGGGSVWAPLGSGSPFGTYDAYVRVRSKARDARFVHSAIAGVDVATSQAPLALWSGADTGTARRHLLRAHPLLAGGVVAGPALGRRLAYMNIETSTPLPGLAGRFLSAALFGDAASAGRRLATARGLAWHVDAGIGLRIRIPGREEALRIDYGRGVRDGADALSIGWTF
ncbi:MAG: cysteine peptidase family C39 domain-containing protein, partial [Vicinamibacterales bacterium]